MKKRILVLGIVLLLTGCGSGTETIDIATENTTDVTTEVTAQNTENIENKEDVKSELTELWDDANILVSYDDKPMIMFQFPNKQPDRQLYDYLTAYSVLEKSYENFSIMTLIEGAETTYLTMYVDNEISYQKFPDTWTEILEESSIASDDINEIGKKAFKNLRLSVIKSDLEIITNVIENIENSINNTESVEIWENVNVKMDFQSNSPMISFEFTGADTPREVYNFFLMYNVLKDSYKTFVISAIIHNEEDIQRDSATIAFLNGESITRILPDSWEKFIDENKNDNDQITFESSLSETTRESDANKLKEVIENAVQ